MLFLATYTPNPIALTIGGFALHWYAIWITAGAVAGFFLFRMLAKQRSIRQQDILDLALWTLVVGFLGARVYHILNEPAYYLAHPAEVFSVWHGGLAVHGGILAGLLTVWIFSRRKGLPFRTLLDTVAPGLLLGQAIGRWGNYFNQELFGRPTDLPWKLFIAPENRPEEYQNVLYFHPTFLYESLGLLLIVVLLLIFRKRFVIPGTLALLALTASQILRVGTESLRIDTTPILLGVRLPLIMGSAIALISIILFFILIKHHGISRNN